VGSLVYFRRGEPLKSRYRRFRVRTVTGSDDVASMAEVLDRYYGRLAEQEEQPADLVVVDGGSGQLAVARRVLATHGFGNAQLIGLAKREETIHREGEELRLPRSSGALKLLQRVRDEAHRFAITYHRLLRDRRTEASVLDRIPGIGQVKKLSLLHHFGSVAAIAAASAQELAAVRGIGPHDAASILTFFEQQAQVGPPRPGEGRRE
jgi:excinuclease ABC subunit C